MDRPFDPRELIPVLQAEWPESQVRLIETHISWVLITDTVAFKIKKNVKFAFVDFRTLASRKHFCEEELRLNQRLAPEIYQAVVPITRDATTGQLSISMPNPAQPQNVVEWAVQMRAFNTQSTLDQAREIHTEQIDAIADVIARFHLRETSVPDDTVLGSAEEIARLALENLEELRLQFPKDSRIDPLSEWTQHTFSRLRTFFEQRKAEGKIKQCHGDLHLGNIAWENSAPIIFDCIEFSDTLRCIDVVNEIAFLFMDLCAKQQPAMAWRMLNRWLEHTGDYEGLTGFTFYACYRALVRAKISMHQSNHTGAENYLSLALSLIAPQQPCLTLMHGLSGSGKTVASQHLLEAQGAIRIRSDVERKRLYGLSSQETSDASVTGGIYQEESTQKTFDRLYALARQILQSGYNVIVDATFLKQDLRHRFIGLANDLGLPAQIADLPISPEICRERILKRHAAGGDASEATLAVLEHQLHIAEPLTPEEKVLTNLKALDTKPSAL